MSRFKVSVTDEFLDAYVNRPLAGIVVRMVERTNITPNQLTLMSGAFGTTAAACLLLPNAFAPIVVAVSLLLCMVLDCSDGQLARLRGGGSVIGRLVDGYVDYWVSTALHLALLVALARSGVVFFGHTFDGLQRFLLVAAAGASMGINSGRFDYYKQRYLAHTGQKREPETPEMYSDEATRDHWFTTKIGLRMFAWYVRMQQGPAFHEAVRQARFTAADPERVSRFEQENGLLVRLWGLTGPTMHNGALAAFACLAPFVPQAFAWYCVFAIVGVNVYCFILHFFQSRVLRRERILASASDSGAHA